MDVLQILKKVYFIFKYRMYLWNEIIVLPVIQGAEGTLRIMKTDNLLLKHLQGILMRITSRLKIFDYALISIASCFQGLDLHF